MRIRRITGSVLLAGVLGLVPGCDDNGLTEPEIDATVISAAGANVDDIAAGIDEFRALLGEENFRITWDGVPDNLSAPFDLPPDFFNLADPEGPAARRRGVVFSTPGSAVQVSANAENPSAAAPRFGNINATYTGVFKAFSEQRLFAAIGSNTIDVTFYLVGTNTPAVVQGFGSVYTGVATQGTSTIEYYDVDGRSLGRFSVPPATNGLSFLGVVFDEPMVHRVRIVHGNTALGPNDGGNIDVAATDDFFFDVPQAIAAH